MKNSVGTVTSLLVGAFVACVLPMAHAQTTTIERQPARAITSLDGKESYTAYCASCHGIDGKGATGLQSSVPDLTTIASRHDGNFDAIAITRVVTGVDKTAQAHRSDDMPVWGPVFSCIQSDQACAIRVHNLVNYLKTIQER